MTRQEFDKMWDRHVNRVGSKGVDIKDKKREGDLNFKVFGNQTVEEFQLEIDAVESMMKELKWEGIL